MWGPVLVVMVAALGCAKTNPYACTDSTQCVLDGEPGSCEPQGYCSFPDSECVDGRRFEPNAGGGLGGTCIEMEPLPDAPSACGAVGQACCSSDNACVDGASCQSGTCAACVTGIALGHRFSCFLKAGGTVWCAGENNQYQLGRAENVPSAMPLQISDETGPIMDATAVFAAKDTGCALRAGGTVWCWGDGRNGEIGDGGAMVDQLQARQVVTAGPEPLTGIVELGGGSAHLCARASAGEIWCWGNAGAGQLGDGVQPFANRSVAARVLVAAGGEPFTGATALVVGGDQNCALKGTELWCWGANYSNQLGPDPSTPRMPFMLDSATSVAAGNYHTCYVKPDTTVACTGGNWHGTIGIGVGGDYNGSDVEMPTSVLTVKDGPPLTGAMSVGAGGAMSCALLTDGTVRCWGDNKHGQIGAGVGNNVPTSVLQQTTGFPELDLVDRILVGWSRACAHRTNGEWWCWGRGRDGEWGDNTFSSRGFAAPLKVGLTCP